MRDFIAIAKALSDENRVRVLMALRDKELCACQIIELLGLAPPTISRHMSILKQARLVECNKNGRWVYYRLAGPDAPPEVHNATQWAITHLDDDSNIRRDAERLVEILKHNPVDACKQQGT